MRVLVDGYIYGRSRFGGMVRYFDSLIRELSNRGYYVGLLLTHEIADHPSLPLTKEFVQTIVTTANTSSSEWDVLLASPSSDASVRARRTILTVHDLIDELHPELVDESSRFAGGTAPGLSETVRRADCIVAISQATKDDLLRYCDSPPGEITVVHHGADAAFLRPAHCFQDDSLHVLNRLGITKPYILVVGGRHGYKNVLKALTAYGTSGSADAYAFVAVGSQTTYSDEERDLIDRLRLDNVLLTGYIGDVDLARLYSSTSLFIMPSLLEGFGLPVLEAMACGAPVACSTTPALVEIGGGIPVFFDGTSVDAIAAGM